MKNLPSCSPRSTSWRTLFPPAFGLALLCMGAALGAAHAANCPVIVLGPVPYPTKTSPLPSVLSSYGTATADLNGDGADDVIFLGNPSLVKFQGDGQGNFGSASNLAVGGLASSVVVSDFNRDKKADLVLGTSTANVRVVLGRGDGTFSSAVTYSASATGTGAASLALAADFDGDLNQDVAVLLSGVGVSVVPGRGDGTFNPPRNSPLATATRGLAVADWNNDGFPDVACLSGNASVAAFLNRGNGTFSSPTNTAFPIAGVYLTGPVAGDFDQDGFPDLALITAVGSAKTEAVILRGSGDGGFTLVQQILISPTPLYTSTVVDINGDGRLDIAIASYTAVTVLEGLGDGTFADPLSFPAVSALNISTGDYNKDQRSDLVVFSAGTSTTMRTLLNQTEFLGPVPHLDWVHAGKSWRLVWYTNYSDYALEYRPAFAPGEAWGPAPGSITPIDCQNFYTISSGQPGFYRLRHP